MGRTALITGITGQDGGYLAELLLEKGYTVHGMVRPTSHVTGRRIDELRRLPQNEARVHLHVADLTDSSSLATLIDRSEPDEIYHLAGQSHVQISFDLPEYTGETTALGTVRLLETIRRQGRPVRFYQAATSEIFGEPQEIPQTEHTPFRPVNPYAAAKLYAFSVVGAYRRAYGLHASNGILFNHESPFRGENYVTAKIARAAAEIAAGRAHELLLGNLEARRDWGFAGDYVQAMWLMVQAEESDDYVIATGESHSVREFCELAFAHVGLDYREHVRQDPRLLRPVDITQTLGDATRAREKLGWSPTISFPELVRMMVDAELERMAPSEPSPMLD
ncbi:MAG: GDP-mannose 4,6-dehydratase [Thermoleophilia bacterium]|nr:GDP-mannose 4,6-dehydratase [Thermoleophilia bacterium]